MRYPSKSQQRVTCAICVVSLLVVITGCGSVTTGGSFGDNTSVGAPPDTTSTTQDQAPITYAPVDPSFPAPSGASLTETVDTIADRVLGPSPRLKLGLTDAPEGFPQSVWLDASGDSGDRSPEVQLNDWWDIALIAGATREQMHADGLGDLGGFVLDNGQADMSGAHGRGLIALHQRFTATGTPTEITADIEAALKAQGLSTTSVEVLMPLQAAPRITVTVSDPKAFIGDANSVIAALFGDQGAYEGYYFQANDEGGKPVFIVARALRFGSSATYFRPDLDPNPGPMSAPPTT